MEVPKEESGAEPNGERPEDAKEVLKRLQQVRLEDTIDATAREVVEGMESGDAERRERAERMLDCQNLVYNVYKSLVQVSAANNPEFEHDEAEYMNVSVLGGRLAEKYGPGELLKWGLEIQFLSYLGATWYQKLSARAERVKQEKKLKKSIQKQEEKSDVQTGDSGHKPSSPLRHG